jgi:hypothetical protein
VVLDNLLNDGRVGQGGDVAQIVRLVCRDLAENSPHDFAGTSFGKAGADLKYLKTRQIVGEVKQK